MFWNKKKKEEKAPAVAKPKYLGPLRFSEYLIDQRIVFFKDTRSHEEVLKTLLSRLPLDNAEDAFGKIWERELQGGTAIAPQLSVPHARIAGIAHLLCAIGISPQPVTLVSGEPINLFVLFLSPQGEMKVGLEFLASLSALFQKETLISEILMTQTPAELIAKIQKEEKA